MPPDLTVLLITSLLFLCTNAEICPIDNPRENPTSEASSSSSSSSSNSDQLLGPIKRLLLKPKTCPDFKDGADQDHCCPSSIAFGTFYCCTLQQKHEIQAAILSERRKQFVKKYLAVIIIVTIGLSVLSIVAASIICKRVSFCPLHHSKGSCSHSSASFQIPSRYYQAVGQGPSSNIHQARHSATFSTSVNLNQTPPQLNKTLVSYDAPPPYESHETYRSISSSSDQQQTPTNRSTVNNPAQLQHHYNLIMENQLNDIIENRPADHGMQNSFASGIQRPNNNNNVFTTVPPPASMQHNLARLDNVE